MRLFYCYSYKLKEELLEKGFKYLHKGVNEKSNKVFWVFEGDDVFNSYLDTRRSKFK